MRSDLSNVRVRAACGCSLEDLAASGANVPIINQTVSALRFFCATLRRHEIVEYTPFRSRATQAARGAQRSFGAIAPKTFAVT